MADDEIVKWVETHLTDRDGRLLKLAPHQLKILEAVRSGKYKRFEMAGVPEKIRIAKEAREAGRFPISKGCQCPCHRGRQGIFHLVACHPDGNYPRVWT